MQKREIVSAAHAPAQLLIPENFQRRSTGGLLDAEFDYWPAPACTCTPQIGLEARLYRVLAAAGEAQA
jgi:hypothetical protein